MTQDEVELHYSQPFGDADSVGTGTHWLRCQLCGQWHAHVHIDMLWDARTNWWTAEHIFFCDGWEQYILSFIQPGVDPIAAGFNGMEVIDYDDEVIAALQEANDADIEFIDENTTTSDSNDGGDSDTDSDLTVEPGHVYKCPL